MDENKTIEIILLSIFLLGIVGLGIFFFAGYSKHPVEEESRVIGRARTEIKDLTEASQKDLIVTEPKVSGMSQVEKPEETQESIAPAEVVLTKKEVIPTEEDIPVPLSDQPKEDEMVVSSSESKEAITEEGNGSRNNSEKIVLETKNGNGTIYKAQEIPAGVVLGGKANADDRADLYKIRAAGEVMALSLEPEMETIKDRSVMTIYDNRLKVAGEYFTQKNSKRDFKVTEGEIYYIKLQLSSIEKPSFEYKLRIEFRNSSTN